jgi:hypothetical protein
MFTPQIGPDGVRRGGVGPDRRDAGRRGIQRADHTNHLTFNGPVGLPGITLPRGTDTFEVVDLHPDIVRVRSRDRSRVYFMGFTTTAARPMDQRADRLVTHMETPPGVPPRIETWYPIGQSSGRRFIYPDARR